MLEQHTKWQKKDAMAARLFWYSTSVSKPKIRWRTKKNNAVIHLKYIEKQQKQVIIKDKQLWYGKSGYRANRRQRDNSSPHNHCCFLFFILLLLLIWNETKKFSSPFCVVLYNYFINLIIDFFKYFKTFICLICQVHRYLLSWL